MKKELKINDFQQLKVREILADMQKEINDQKQSNKTTARPNFIELRKNMKSAKKELAAKFAKVLTTEQQKKWYKESDSWISKEN